ncbi:MAG TPA: threonine synthase [Pyrinomonadaceae bacterium]|nr:threonine synthase [Pyrinomonadaceae bacterium]
MNTVAQVCIESDCGARLGLAERIYRCPKCGGLLEIAPPFDQIQDAAALPAIWKARRESLFAADRSGVWRFRELLPFPADVPLVSLSEGNTPLYDAPQSAAYCRLDSLRLKHQGANPTGSFKDTGMTTAVTQAAVIGARTVVCASTGNTAASLAAYAARAGLRCAILIPEGQVSHGKLAQALDYGARVLEIAGNFDDCMRLANQLAASESIYLVNSINPFRIEGQKTVAVELLEQLSWQPPDHVVVPGGNLGNSSALGKGFAELSSLGLITRLPRLSVIQAEGAAPFAAAFRDGPTVNEAAGSNLEPWPHPQTLATAIKIGAPVSWKKALRAVLKSGGDVVTVSEGEIADAKAVIGRDGIGCEPASATTVAGIRKLVASGAIKASDNVVAVLTGHVLKDSDYVIKYHQQSLQTGAGGRLKSAFANTPRRVEGEAAAIMRELEG